MLTQASSIFVCHDYNLYEFSQTSRDLTKPPYFSFYPFFLDRALPFGGAHFLLHKIPLQVFTEA